MKKQAYLIIAHNEFDILKKLLNQIDFKYNDIYLLIDKKVSVDFDQFKKVVRESNLFIIPRIKISWGDYSLLQAELNLLKEANDKKYSYFHILSGVDLLLKPVDEIYKYFDKSNKQFMEVLDIGNDNDILDRVKYYYFLQRFSSNKILLYLNKFIVKIQKILHVNRLDYSIEYGKGSNWCSITYEFAEYLVKNESRIKKLFKFGFCVDELFLQTMLLNSKFKEDLVNNNLRFIVWDENHVSSPKTLSMEDYESLVKSDCLFARKFQKKKSDNLMQKYYGRDSL